MGNETFSVGEIAIICNPPNYPPAQRWDGAEVEIVSPLANREWIFRGDGTLQSALAYECLFPDGEVMCIRPKYLRKKRPPREPISTWDDVIVWRPRETSHV